MLEIDVMTGLSSRHIFDMDMESYRRAPPSPRLAMIMFDLNNLKQVNDTLGHKTGDELIQATATLIRETFAAHGSCYRIGGDEFVAILPEIDEDSLSALIAGFNATAEECRKDGSLFVDVAVGYGFYSAKIDKNISGLFTRVDDAMYHNKRLKKQGRPSGAATQTIGRRSTDLLDE
jgi:diguanylate cyclase (GGDEF)-like protein